MPTVLVIDDEDDIRKLIARILKLEGYTVHQAEDGKRGLRTLERETIHVTICDVRLPDANGVDLVPKIRALNPHGEVILLTAFGTIRDGVAAVKRGAFDYITKGDDNNKIIPLVSRAMDKAQLQFRAAASSGGGAYRFENIVGKSKPMQRAVRVAQRVAKTDTTVLLNGETGTGKEVFAQSIHHASDRSDRSFVAVNCSALGKELLESEMFGHKAGAFTGATKNKDGLFEEADGGTIFLDEIGEMDLVLQAKLLRVLETGTFLKVGETKERKVDVRVIAATNRDLEREAENNNFRLDLYYRLSVFKILLPNLQQRRDDIPLLADHFIERSTAKMGMAKLKMDASFVDALRGHAWRGNIRELKNVIERSVILAEGDTLTEDVLPFDFLAQAGSVDPNDSLKLAAMEARHIKKVLQHTGGNKTRSAELLGIGLTTLYRKIEEYRI